MAAEHLLTFAVDESLRRMISIAAEGIGLAWGLNGQLQKLVDSLTMIQAVLLDAATRPAAEDGVKRWLDKLQDVAHDAEDVLDEFDYEQKRKVCDFVSLHNPIVFRWKMGHKVKRIHGALDEILKLGGDLGLANRPEVRRDPPRQTDSFLDSSADTSAVVVGREDDVSKVVEWLTESKHVLSVVPIVGMAGLGKTTIAKNVYKEVKERKLFNETIWVCVSNHFDEVKILREMLQTIDKTTGALENIDAILQNLKKQLENKTFLLVLDDVWNRNRNKWNGLKDGLLKIKSKNGNAIVVTTRIREVASMMGTSPGIQLEPEKLSDDECWFIIKQKVSGGGGAPLAADSESIGKEIAKKCGGLPLLANVLGGTLRQKETKEWESILSNRFWHSTDGNEALDILRFSFDHLSSPSLKKCFAYCSIFPKDFEIEWVKVFLGLSEWKS